MKVKYFIIYLTSSDVTIPSAPNAIWFTILSFHKKIIHLFIINKILSLIDLNIDLIDFASDVYINNFEWNIN